MKNGNEKKNKGVIAALHGKSVIHSGGQTADDEIESQDAYVDLDDDRSKKIEKELKE